MKHIEHTIKLSSEDVLILHLAILTDICSHKECKTCLLSRTEGKECIANKIIKQNIDEARKEV